MENSKLIIYFSIRELESISSIVDVGSKNLCSPLKNTRNVSWNVYVAIVAFEIIMD